MSLPGWIRREGTPLNPRSGELGSRQVVRAEGEGGRPAAREDIQHNLRGLNKQAVGRTGAAAAASAVYPIRL